MLDWTKLGISAGTVHDVFPIMRSAAILRAWAGIEARMPDEIPVLVRAARARAFSTSSASRGMDSSDCDADENTPSEMAGDSPSTEASAGPSRNR